MVTGEAILVNGEAYLPSKTCLRRWAFLEALYFVVATLSAVGYWDLAAKNDLAKLFVAVYIFAGFGLVVNVASSTLASALWHQVLRSCPGERLWPGMRGAARPR